MGKIVVKDDSADSTDAKATAKSEKPKQAKAKASKTPGSELVVAPARAVAVVNKKKTAKAGAGKKKVKVIEGVVEESEPKASGAKADEVKPEKTGSTEKTSGTKKAAKSLSGMVIDSTVVKPAGTKAKVDAKADGYAVDEPKAGEEVKKKKEGEPGQPRFSKPKSALIGVGVALAVAIVGFVGIWFFSRKPVEKCVVQFEPNGGSQVNAQSVICGTMAKEPEAPTKDGFDFVGWAFEGLMFDFEKTPVSKNMTLIAWWDAHADTEVVRVSFDTAGGSAMSSIEIKKGSVLETIATRPTRYGYLFAGWYLGDEPFDFSQAINENLTLVAHWREKPQDTNNNSGNNSGSAENNGGSSAGEDDPAVDVVVCDPLKKGSVSGLTVEVGLTTRVSSSLAYYQTTGCNVSYRTSDRVKIELTDNIVKGLVAGDAKVAICLAEADGKEVECTEVPVTVTEKVVEPEVVEVTGVSIEGESERTVQEGTHITLHGQVAPGNATSPIVSWTSSNTDVAVVVGAANGNGEVDTVGVGTATVTISVKSANGESFSASVVITVPCGDGLELDEATGACVEKKDDTGGDEEEPAP